MAGKGDSAPDKRKKELEKKGYGKKGKPDMSKKEKDNSSSDKFETSVAKNDDDSLNKTEEPVVEKDDDSLNKSEEPVIENDDGSLNKTEEPVEEKDDDPFNKTEKLITEKNSCSLNKTEMPLTEKTNESEKPMTDTENSTGSNSKKSKNMKKENDKEQSTSFSLKECFRSVKVSKHDATKVQIGLEGEIFDKFSEGCEVMNATKIPFANLNGYLDYLQGAFEGIDDDVRKNINSKLFNENAWNSKMVEWNFKQPDDSGIRYGLVAFGRSKDQQYVDCMYVLYKMDFALTPHAVVTEKKYSWLLGLKTYTSLKVEFIEQHLDAQSIHDIQNFFRVKALEKIYKEGYIESINFVDEKSDSKCDLI